MVCVEQCSASVETATVRARFESGRLVSLSDRVSGRDFLTPGDGDAPPVLELVYNAGPHIAFSDAKPLSIVAVPVSQRCMEFRLHGWDADGVIRISECAETGDILVEPSAYSSRAGVRACRWHIAGLARDLELVAPIYQGIHLPLEDDLIRGSHWSWPLHWEAGFAVLQGKDAGFWVHARDRAYRYKALGVGVGGTARGISLDTEAYGPVDVSLGTGGLVWRLNAFRGDWRVPAARYRDWLWRAYHLEERVRQRQEWVRDIAFAVSWCDGNPELLDALATRVPPERVLIHFPNWRQDAYDENYPDFTPSAPARAFIAKGAAMGFHILPHCNAVDMDPSHPVYSLLRDFSYRDVSGKGLLGWGYEAGRILSVPNSYASLGENRRRKVMVKIHPGLSMWRSVLADSIRHGLTGLDTDAVFIDVTLCSFNLHNCLVENMTSTEGMRLLIDQVAEIGEGLAVGGEGLNEITMQGLSFAQAHLFRSHHASCDGLERAGGCPVNAFLFSQLCRTFGYSRLSGRTEDERLRSRVHLSLGAIPTITGLRPDEILSPSPAVSELLSMAAS